MFNFKDHPIRSGFLWFGQVCIASLLGVMLLIPPATAEANFFDTIKDIYHLPSDVQNLQNQYEEAKKNYDDTMQQVAEQKQQLVDQSQRLEEQSKQILEEAQKARETEEQLTQQNKELQDHNSELQARLQVMEKTVSSKDKWIHRIKVTGITFVSVVVLYFILGRLFRVFIWRRNNKNRAH